VPVLPGIMPITSYGRLMRIHELSGQRIPPDLAERLRQVQDDPAAGRDVGMTHAIAMSEELLAQGAPCLHFYTFNRSKATIEVLTALGMAPAIRR
jgi:methylenetetrahydrofolate reductase (NADPH)